jgi:hypothetical protein
MNKLEGFFELQTLPLPAIPWKRFTGSEIFAEDSLWTVRSAVVKGADFNLPRKVGVPANEARTFAEELLHRLSSDDYVLFYPFFIAEKSGTLTVSAERTVIEAVQGDLWNLLTYNRPDITVIQEKTGTRIYGNSSFLTAAELAEIGSYADFLRRRYGTGILIRESLILEWSFAREAGSDGRPKGPVKLQFIEMRSVS